MALFAMAAIVGLVLVLWQVVDIFEELGDYLPRVEG